MVDSIVNIANLPLSQLALLLEEDFVYIVNVMVISLLSILGP